MYVQMYFRMTIFVAFGSRLCEVHFCLFELYTKWKLQASLLLTQRTRGGFERLFAVGSFNAWRAVPIELRHGVICVRDNHRLNSPWGSQKCYANSVICIIDER
jgi:hypothetical protein